MHLQMSSPRMKLDMRAMEFVDDGIILVSDVSGNFNVLLNQPVEQNYFFYFYSFMLFICIIILVPIGGKTSI